MAMFPRHQAWNAWQALGTSHQQMALSQVMEVTNVCSAQRQRATFRWRTATLLGRRHSNDGTAAYSGAGATASQAPADPDCFHPYRRQFSDGATQQHQPVPRLLPRCPPPYDCFQEAAGHHCVTRSLSSDALASWDQGNYSFEASDLEGSPADTYSEHPAAPLDPACFLPQNRPLGPPPQLSLTNGRPASPQYSLPGGASHQESTAGPLFPKPIYSYSILIFMALKNSKTGSLPVSEIYNFITEQFPYFKTAPDGWKNSVRHNLSLNKCFEKVENQAGNASRKGCLWALSPAKVEKMQEEMNKWRRKDPVSVRKCMARPEDHDRLFGDRPGVPHHHTLSSVSRGYSSGLRAHKPRAPHRRPHFLPSRRDPSPPPRPCYPSPVLPGSFPLYSACVGPSHPGGPSALLGGCLYPQDPGSMRDLLLEGEGLYDVDTLNPSLTDLQLHGNLWEELKEDSLVPDCLASVIIVPDISPPPGRTHSNAQKVVTPVGVTPEMIRIDLAREEEVEEEKGGRTLANGFSLEQHMNGLYPTVYSGAECLAGYLTSCATPMPFL